MAVAASRAGAPLYDEAIGLKHTFRAKAAIVHSDILLPPGAPARWRDRGMLCNEVERVEPRRNATLARVVEVSLPRELSEADGVRLAGDFASGQFVRLGMVADLNVGWGRAADGLAQPYAHIMLTTCKVERATGDAGAAGFGLKEPAWNARSLLLGWHAAWADLVNIRLGEVGIAARVDHRSYAARALALEPQNKIGAAGLRRDRRGEDAERADEHREIARRNGGGCWPIPSSLARAALREDGPSLTRADVERLARRQSDGAEQFAAVLERLGMLADDHGD